MIDYKAIDKSWTLFLDRDGVINVDKDGSYIFNKDEFFFIDGSVEAVKMLTEIFGLIVVVTNQKGVGRGLMTLDDLNGIHELMQHEITAAGGHIEKIYFCSDLSDDSPNRKPNAGMAFQAQKDFPQINFSKSIIVGNRLSDMQFGRNAGLSTVFVATTHPETAYPHPLIDERFNTLYEFAKHVSSANK
jgi:histidinol-phosphate phosphatase family protein